MRQTNRKSERKQRSGLQRGAALFAISLSVFLICQFIFIFGPRNPIRSFFQRIELSLFDSRVAALPRLKPDPRIVIVGMDDATLEKLPLLDRPYYPLPRTYHAKLVNELFAAGAKVIGFDIMFTLEQKDEDPAFARALHRHGHVVAALTPDTSLDNGEEIATFSLPAKSLSNDLIPASILVPQPVRWFDPYRVDDGAPGKRWPHFGLAVVAAYFREATAIPTLRDTFHWGTHIDAPLANGEDVLMRYAGPAGTFKPIPYYKVYDGSWRRDYPANLFRGKIVLVGRISDLEDIHETTAGDQPMPGVEVLANIAQMGLTHNYLRQATAETGLEAALLLMAIYLFVLWRYSIVPAAVMAALTSGVWAFVITPYYLNHFGLWIDAVEPLLTLALTVVAASIYESWRVSEQFERFVPSWVAARVMTGTATGTDGEATAERPVSVVFCDIRNFTSISEKSPGEAAEILRLFYEQGDRLARRHGTELDKYVGDQIMLYFFDRPRKNVLSREAALPHAVRAVRWAQDMLTAARSIDATGLAGDIGFRIGIGIATGLAREGLVGVHGRVQNTVIGDVVNVASRLQEVTKELDRPILMGERTYSEVRGFIKVEPIGQFFVKGKQEPLMVYGLTEQSDAARKESQ